MGTYECGKKTHFLSFSFVLKRAASRDWHTVHDGGVRSAKHAEEIVKDTKQKTCLRV